MCLLARAGVEGDEGALPRAGNVRSGAGSGGTVRPVRVREYENTERLRLYQKLTS